MKCPNCGNPKIAYTVRKPKKSQAGQSKSYDRKDFSAKCEKCEWEGDC